MVTISGELQKEGIWSTLGYPQMDGESLNVGTMI